MNPYLRAIAGALWAAALSTLGDWIWARFIPAHRPVFGLAVRAHEIPDAVGQRACGDRGIERH